LIKLIGLLFNAICVEVLQPLIPLIKQTIVDCKKWELEDEQCTKLKQTAGEFIETIILTPDKYPWPIVKLLSIASELSQRQFGVSDHYALSNLVFLRFFCTFIIFPDNFIPLEISTKQRKRLISVGKVLQAVVNDNSRDYQKIIDLDDIIQQYSPLTNKYLDDILATKGTKYEKKEVNTKERFRDVETIIEFYKKVGKEQDLSEMVLLIDNIYNHPDYQKILASPRTKKSKKAVKLNGSHELVSVANDKPNSPPKKDISSWGKRDVCRWVKSLGMEPYEKTFYSNSVNGDKLVSLTSTSLLDLGIINLAHRKKIIKEKELLVEKEKMKTQNLVHMWSVEDVYSWAKCYHHCKTFRENIRLLEINGAELCEFDTKKILELGVVDMKTRKELVDGLGDLKKHVLSYLCQKDVKNWSSNDVAGLFVVRKHPAIARQVKKVQIKGGDLSTLHSFKLQSYGFSIYERTTFLAEIHNWKNIKRSVLVNDYLQK